MATPIPANRAPISAATLRALTERAELPDVLGASTDTRTIEPGMLYVALRGERFDGAEFVAQAFAAGAVGALVPAPIEGEPRAWCVQDTLIAWGELARAHLAQLRATAPRVVIAITGSAGKTTTKEMTAALLRARGTVHATVGNLNNRIGLPATLLAATDQTFLVLEAGMSLPGEMAELSRIATPDLAAVINVGLAHAEGVGGREGIAHEKSALYTHLREGGAVVALCEDALVWDAAQERTRIGFGERDGRYRVLAREVCAGGASLQLQRDAESLHVRSPFAGAAQALDLAAALALADAALARVGQAALTVAEIEAALAQISLDGRGARFEFAGGGFVIDDSYNANPDSMARAVTLLGELAEDRRRVLVLGEMRELGAEAESAHDAIGEHVANAKPALVIGCGGLAERILARVEAAGIEVLRAADAAHAALLATRAVLPEDAVVVKASRGVRAERVVQALREQFGDLRRS